MSCHTEVTVEPIRLNVGVHDYQHNANPVSVKITNCCFILTYSTRYFVNEMLIYIFVNAAQPRKTKGAAKGLKLQSAWQANQGRPLPIEFDWRQRTIAPIGPNCELVSRFISNHLK